MKAVRSVLELLAPALCWSCGARAGRIEPLCAGCRRELRWLAPEPVVLEGLLVWAPLAYEGGARALVGGLKFHGAAHLASSMAAAIAANLPPGLLAPTPASGGPWHPQCRSRARLRADEAPELVPVPLHPARLRSRGYNQALLLANELARRTGLRASDPLERRGSRRTQVGRPRAERLTGVEVALRGGARVPARAILIDDVATTGATLRACSEALEAAGALASTAITYARTPGR